jgi:8-oxo-dGTP pyrophosphatase MutT (NUDIX family)
VNERFDLASLRRRLLPHTPSRSEETVPIASVALIINPEDRGGSVLLIRRTERSGDPWSGQIGFPGGHKSPYDQGLPQTAIREAEEEVGIELSKHDLLGAMPLVTTRSRRVQVAPFVFALKSPERVRINREVAESFWVPLVELMRLDVKRRRVPVEDGELEVNSFDYQGRIVWGLTFRILNLLLNRDLEVHL